METRYLDHLHYKIVGPLYSEKSINASTTIIRHEKIVLSISAVGGQFQRNGSSLISEYMTTLMVKLIISQSENYCFIGAVLFSTGIGLSGESDFNDRVIKRVWFF